MSNDIIVIEPLPEQVEVIDTKTDIITVSTGEIGPQGPPGPPGSGFVVEQPTLAGSWVIPNPIGRVPSVAAYDENGQQVFPDVYASLSTITLVFAHPTKGAVVIT